MKARPTLGIARAVFHTTRPFSFGWGVLAYYTLLVLGTDAVVWKLAGKVGRIDADSLVRYSLLAYPAWMLLASKGLGKEQVDLREQGRWHAVDLLPGGMTVVFLAHHLGQTLRMPALRVWVACYVATCLWVGAGPASIALGLGCLVTGSLNIVSSGILLRAWSPSGYSGVLGAMFYSLTWILSGAVFPLGILGLGPAFEILNPFGASLSMPLSLVLAHGHRPSLEQLSLVLLSSSAWLCALLRASRTTERIRRAALHA